MNTGLSLNKKEFIGIIINAISIKMLFSYPKMIVDNSGTACWIECIFVSLIALALYLITIKLYDRSGQRGLLEMINNSFSKPGKIIIAAIIITALIANVAMTTRIYPESVKNVLLPTTPMKLIVFLFTVASIFGAFCGFDAIARIHAIYIPLISFVFLLLILLLLPHININNIFPVLGKGTYKIFITGTSSLSLFSDIFVIYILLPYTKNYSECKKSGTLAIILSSIISVVICIFYVLIYEYPASGEFIYPVYQITRLIKVGDFFQRLDAFFEFFWSIGMMLYNVFYIYIISVIFCKLFSVKNINPVIPITAFLITSVSYLPDSVSALLDMTKTVYSFTTPLLYLIPIITAIIYNIRTERDI